MEREGNSEKNKGDEESIKKGQGRNI